MYEYAVNTRKVSSDKKFVTVNCSEYANNPELLTANLFGAKKGS
ncbi:sigma 54-interacting transcriptional regulator [Clostridium perfringens]|nr:sigma 54-interacting transcriptional regulator [Clostridium perfringens]